MVGKYISVLAIWNTVWLPGPGKLARNVKLAGCEFGLSVIKAVVSLVGTAAFLLFLSALAIRAKEAQKGERGRRKSKKRSENRA